MSNSLRSRIFGVVLASAVVATACGEAGSDSGPSSLPLTEVPATADPLESLEVTGAAPSSVISTTTTTTSTVSESTTTSITATTGVPSTSVIDGSVCEAGEDFPEFEGAVSFVRADIDLDGEDDEIFLLADPVGLAHDAWIAISFGNGGLSTGRWDSFFEVDTIPSALHIVEHMTVLQQNSNQIDQVFTLPGAVHIGLTGTN